MPNVTCHDDAIVEQAQQILFTRLKESHASGDTKFGSVNDAKAYLALKMSGLEVEHFDALFLDPHGRLIAHENLFKGGVDEVETPPREVCRRALLNNAAFVILAHNHPSGDSTPSDPDKLCTITMLKALMIVGVQMCGAYVVAGPRPSDVQEIIPDRKMLRDAGLVRAPDDFIKEMLGTMHD